MTEAAMLRATCEAPPERGLAICAADRVESVGPLDYLEVRDLLRDGDLVLFRGKGRLSKLIVKASKGEYSHVGMILWWGGLQGRLMVVEAHWPGGLRAVPLSWLLCEYEGNLDLYRLKPEYRPRPDEIHGDGRLCLRQGQLLREATYLLGRKFAVYDLFRVGMRHMFGWSWPKDTDGTRDLFCSEYISRVLNESGLDPSPEADLKTTPTDLARCEYFEKLGQVVVSPDRCREQRTGKDSDRRPSFRPPR